MSRGWCVQSISFRQPLLELPLFQLLLSKLVPATPSHASKLARLDREEGGRRGAGAASASRPAARVHVRSVLRVHPLPPHGTQLTTFRHEHDDKGDARASDQATRRAHVLITSGHDEAGEDPDDPDGDGEADGETDVHGLSVILPHTPGLEGEQDNDEDEEDNVEQAEQLLLEESGTCDEGLSC